MTALSDAQLATAARQAGFTGDQVAVAVAVALAESGGNPAAHNTNAGTGDNSYGLWQINMLGALGPAWLKTLGLASNDALFDPVANAQAAYAISSGGTSWSPWSTYKSGAYRQYLARGQAAASGSGGSLAGIHIPLPGGGINFGNPLDGVTDTIGGALGSAVAPFVDGLRRLSVIGLAVGGGVALVVLGAWRGVRSG